MYHHRGLDLLLDAAPKVVEKIPDVKFVLLGDGPEMEKLQNIVKEKNLDNNVDFKGWINRNDIPKNISDAAIGIGPLKRTTVTENALPIKVLEYMACSLPIIAIEGTLPNDVLKNNTNGIFVKDASELAEKIIFILKNSNEGEKMGKNSLQMVQKFSWENVVKSILEAYNKI